MALLEPGCPAPGFQLKNHDNQLISLDQFLGKWVITYFYPKALTPGCTAQACGLRDTRADWQRLNAVTLGISPDKPTLLKKFVESEQLPFQLLSDESHIVAESYGTWQEKSMYGRKYMGMARATYLISPDGKIAHVIPKADPKTHALEIVDWLTKNGAPA